MSEGQGVTPPPLEADVLSALSAIGLTSPSPEDPLHVALVAALRRNRGASWGAQIVAMTFEFNWAHLAAGKRFVTAKVNLKKHVRREVVRLRAEQPSMSEAAATRQVEDSDDVYELTLVSLLAEQEERALRSFLSTLKSALDNHRTDRADQRAADTAHSQGIGGAS